ncbi:MAG: DUF3306 domain-containing protein [Tagaea sp.]
MRSEGESRLGRWARLKAEARAAEREAEAAAAPPPAEPVPPAVQDSPPASVETKAPEKREDEKQVELPPLDSLTKDSDFSLFMRGGVSADARKAALRKLWTLDSHFAQIDISECHSIDFNAVPTFPEGLKNTIYRAGRGMVEAVEEIERQEREAAEKARALAGKSDSHDAAPLPSDDLQAKDDPAPPTGVVEAPAESPKTKHS